MEETQKALTWLANLALFPKVLVTSILCAVFVFSLFLIWAKPQSVHDTVRSSIPAVKAVLAGCYRRAVFTRTHAQLSQEAMFASISECRKLVQIQIPHIEDHVLRTATADILMALTGIEAEQKAPDFSRIDAYKLVALNGLLKLSQVTGVTYIIPRNLTEEFFFSETEANLPPTIK